jgi:enolase
MANLGPTLVEIDQRIADIRENLRELIEQAAAFSGAGDEERISQRIADQQAQLDRLTKERDEIVKQKK